MIPVDQYVGKIPLLKIRLKSYTYIGIMTCLEDFICSFTISSTPPDLLFLTDVLPFQFLALLLDYLYHYLLFRYYQGILPFG